MIFGSYPCCDGDLSLGVPDDTPAFVPEACPHCGAKVWHKLSRFDPESWTEADFLETYKVDEVTRKVELRDPPKPLTPAQEEIQRRFAAYWTKTMEEAILNTLLYGHATIEVDTGQPPFLDLLNTSTRIPCA